MFHSGTVCCSFAFEKIQNLFRYIKIISANRPKYRFFFGPMLFYLLATDRRSLSSPSRSYFPVSVHLNCVTSQKKKKHDFEII